MIDEGKTRKKAGYGQINSEEEISLKTGKTSAHRSPTCCMAVDMAVLLVLLISGEKQLSNPNCCDADHHSSEERDGNNHEALYRWNVR